MSSHPPGLRFTSYSSQTSNNQQQQSSTNGKKNSNIHNNTSINSNNIITKNLKPQPQQQGMNKKSTNSSTANTTNTTKHQFTTDNSLSGSETDISTSTENLSMEQRYVLRHTPRVEPQGQENLQESTANVNENSNRYVSEQHFSSNTSSDSTRYASSNRSLSEARNPIFVQQTTTTGTTGNVTGNNTSNRNSLKEVNSNRSSMDVSTCSYNTLIIHNDDNSYLMGNREYPSPPPSLSKKERPRSYGEHQGGMQEITEIPDDYLNQSHVLKHLAKEIKIPSKCRSSSIARDSGITENTDTKDNQKFEWIIEEPESPNKSKSKSQPDLTKLTTTEAETMESLAKENAALKQQLLMCCMKVAKTQKLEDEVANIYRVYEELVQSCERREKLERVARMRLQENLQKVQALNRALKDQVDIFQTQLLAPSEHQILIAQLFTQNKELSAAKERQDIELAAQQATLQEQRTHIGILDTALNNAQRNIRRLEEELRKKQLYIERLTQLAHGASASSSPSLAANQLKQNERKLRLDYETELSKDSNRSGSSTNSDSKWQIQEKANQIMSRLESEQRHLDDQAMRQNASKLCLEKTQETDRMIAEVKHDKLRYLEEVHSAQRKVSDLQAHLKGLEARLAEKDALIRALQNQKICGSSFDSYNLSTDSFALNPLRYNSPSSFNASNTSFNTTTNTSLLEPTTYGGANTSTNYNTSSTSGINGGITAVNSYGQNTSSAYNQSVVNLQSLSIPGNYSPNSSSNYSANFDPNTNYMTQNSPTFNTSSSYDNQYDDHMKKQIDEQLNKFETLQRGLCCFPSLSNKKPNQPLLSDEISVLSTNNSDAFLQKLAHLDQRERERQESENQLNKNKTEEIVLLEKQGRCSQKIRNNASGNLAQVTQNVGQNMTDISNIGNSPTQQGINSLVLPPKKERGNSLPPSALPRPPRSLKPPRKIEYDRLSDSELKKCSQTPSKINSQNSTTYEMKTSSLKRDFPSTSSSSSLRNDYHQSSPTNNYGPIKEAMSFTKNDISAFKRKNYGTMNTNDSSITTTMTTTTGAKFGFKTATEFSKPDFTSTKKYQRLEDTPKIIKTAPPPPPPTTTTTNDSNSLKRSLLPGTRKLNALTSNNNINNISNNNNNNIQKNSRDSFNSNGSNNSNQSSVTSRNSPMHIKSDSGSSHLTLRLHSKTPPKFLQYNSVNTSTSPNNQINSGNNNPMGIINDGHGHGHGNNSHINTNNNNNHISSSRLQQPSLSSSSQSVQIKSSLPIPNSTSSSLPPKPIDTKTGRRGSSLSRNGENRYRIQF